MDLAALAEAMAVTDLLVHVGTKARRDRRYDIQRK